MGLLDIFRKPKAPAQASGHNIAMLAARRVREQLALPNRRQSKDAFTFTGLLGRLEDTFSGYPGDSAPRIRKVLRYLAQFDEDAAGALRDLQTLACPGFSIEYVGGARAVKAAQDDEKAWLDSVFPGGFEGLAANQVREVFVGGATSVEWVPARDRRSVKLAIPVQVETIQIRRDEDSDELHYYQHGTSLQPILLHPLTYRYFPVQTEGSSPYGIPVAISALHALDRKRKLLDAEARVINLMARSALVKAGVPKPTPRDLGVISEEDAGYTDALTAYYAEVADLLMAETENGLYVGPKDVEIEVTAISQTAAGADQIVKGNQHRAWNGLGTVPFLRGEMGSTNYALASVVWPMVMALAKTVRLPIAAQLEHGRNLDLRLKGIPVVAWVHFHEPQTAFEKDRAETLKIKAEAHTLLEKLFGAAWAQHAMREFDVGPDDAKQAPEWWPGIREEDDAEEE